VFLCLCAVSGYASAALVNAFHFGINLSMVWPINCVYYKINDMPPLKKREFAGVFRYFNYVLKKETKRIYKLLLGIKYK